MTKRPTLPLILSAAAPALAFLVIAYFVLSAIIGPNGVLAWGDYRTAISKRQTELAAAEHERATLAHRAALLDPRRGVDPDLADELVRSRTDQVREDEVILPIR